MARWNQTLTFDRDTVENLDLASLYPNRDRATRTKFYNNSLLLALPMLMVFPTRKLSLKRASQLPARGIIISHVRLEKTGRRRYFLQLRFLFIVI